MDLYTLTDQFLTNEPLDEFVSAIWTERYSAAGDVQLVVQANEENINKLKPGTYLALRGSREIMLLETESMEKGLMTVTGKSLAIFLKHRYAWFRNPAFSVDDDTTRIMDYTLDDPNWKKPGEFISHVVDKMVINTTPFPSGEYFEVNLSWELEEIPNLSLGAIDTSGTQKRLTMPIGPLYDGITDLAGKEGVGISLYLESASPVTGYVLKFITYRGVDHTTGSGNPLIRLEPDLDSLQNIKEIRSNDFFKNVCYVYFQGKITKHLLDPTQPEPEGMERRIIIRNAEGEPVGRKIMRYGGAGYYYPDTIVGAAEIAAFRAEQAKEAFNTHNYIQAIDGETSPQSDYKYGVHYGLGDIIELKSLMGVISKARITEYIRTQDNTGEREYPTISVIAPEGG